MSYRDIIINATKCPENEVAEIEDYMRHIYFESNLSNKTLGQLQKGARISWKEIQWMRSPDGQAYIASLTTT